MSASIGSLRRGGGAHGVGGSSGALGWTLAMLSIAGVVGMLAVKADDMARLIVGLAIVLIYVIIALNSRSVALSLVVLWLTFLGFTRRLLIPFVGWPEFDPLLLLGPTCAIVLWITQRERLRRTGMSTMVAILFGIGFAQMFNPHGSSLLTGLFGGLFWVGPLIWFFVGRSLEEHHVMSIYRLVTILLIPVALHGLRQSFGMFLPFEYTWLEVSGFGEAIFLEGFKIRPFSFLTSPQEYGYFLSFGLTVLWARILLEPRGHLWKIPLFLVSLAALYLQGGRTIFAFFLLMLVATTALRARVAGARLLAIAVVALLVTLLGMRASNPGQITASGTPGGSSASTLARHQSQLFTDPGGGTAPLHRDLIVQAFRDSLDRPLGVGTGDASFARKKVTKEEKASPENDVATAFLALGLPAGLLLIVFVIMSFRRAFRRHRLRMSVVSLATAGVLFGFITQWWSGQMYTVSALFWLTLGALARPGEEDPPEVVEGRPRAA